MKNSSYLHSFHIPVLGIGFSVDTPVKVAPYGISSVLSLVDDMLMEKLREYYCGKYNRSFHPISGKEEDSRARRITGYLNLIDELVQLKFNELKKALATKGSEFRKFMDMLPDYSVIKQQFNQFQQQNKPLREIQEWVGRNLAPGSIDVNIMTKLDKENYFKKEKLPTEYNDAHAALRGYANSNLNSSIVFSAGINPRLYSYLENFEDFFPDENGYLKKKVVIKVSDYKSALVQGKFLAKKGIWVSEFRIESGLNCGGHAFATEGYLMGPILQEFKDNREELINSMYEIYKPALEQKNKYVPSQIPDVRFSAQGGVGTSEEHEFLRNYYGMDSIGWGTPFLLVPEATNVDEPTLKKLEKADENDLYLSNISPLGVPFNSLRGNSKDDEKMEYIRKGRPGSPCPKKYTVLSKEFTDEAICTASRQYQSLKIKELKAKALPEEKYKKAYHAIIDKSCLCVGLGTAALLVNNLDTKTEKPGVSICPGPNMAYFSKVMKLEEMAEHIYGRINVIKRNDRPHMFIKELSLYLDYLKNKLNDEAEDLTDSRIKYFSNFRTNLRNGIDYYYKLFSGNNELLQGLNKLKEELNALPISLVTQVN